PDRRRLRRPARSTAFRRPGRRRRRRDRAHRARQARLRPGDARVLPRACARMARRPRVGSRVRVRRAAVALVTLAARRSVDAPSCGVASVCIPGWSARAPLSAPYPVGVLPGEGIGPEVVAAALTVLDAVADSFELEFDVR